MEVANWAFKGYGLRWKIVEYKLEDMQMKTFMGVQSILAVITVAMCMIYKNMKSLHMELLLDAGTNYLNKYTISELINFIYTKISKSGVQPIDAGNNAMENLKYRTNDA